MPHSNFSKIEIDFFNQIKDDLTVIFDVGSRDDIDYIKNSYDRSREFHLFDPDPKFILSSEDQINNLEESSEVNNGIYLNAFGLGKEDGIMAYYPNTQSFVFRTHHARSYNEGISFPIKTLDGYCNDKNVNNIDFLKVDIEGMELDFLMGGSKIINESTKIIQFEFASTLVDKGVDADDLFYWFDREIFDLYLQKVATEHPYHQYNDNMLTLLDEELYLKIKDYMLNAYGCNLVAIRKEHSENIINKLKDF
jgi:FkbM family methyltransferase